MFYRVLATNANHGDKFNNRILWPYLRSDHGFIMVIHLYCSWVNPLCERWRFRLGKSCQYGSKRLFGLFFCFCFVFCIFVRLINIKKFILSSLLVSGPRGGTKSRLFRQTAGTDDVNSRVYFLKTTAQRGCQWCDLSSCNVKVHGGERVKGWATREVYRHPRQACPSLSS